MVDIRGKTALVTGAARRLGRAIALALAEQGCHVVVHYHHSEEQAIRLCRELQEYRINAMALQADLSNPQQTQGLFEQALDAAGPVSILINNASIYPAETLTEVSAQSFEANMRIHGLAPLLLSRLMAQQGIEGQIVNMLDTRAVTGDPKHWTYHLSKRTLTDLTTLLALELAPSMTVNGVAPGLILPPPGRDESYLQHLAHTNPLHRYGHPRDITDAVLFLLTSTFMTGQILFIDGGHHMKGRLYV